MAEAAKTYADLVSLIEKSEKEYDLALIEKAYKFAEAAHQGQVRRSGEPYIIHPIAVAYKLVEFGMDTPSVVAGLLHDVIEDTPVTYDDIVKAFGKEIANLTDGVTKLGKIPFSSREEQQAENLRKMLIAMSEDIRVIIIKFADRMHNLATLEYVAPQKQRDKALECLEVYAPIAHRLGMRKVKEYMEDVSLKYLDPVAYKEIEDNLEARSTKRKQFIETTKEMIRSRVEPLIPGVYIEGRVKSVNGIYRKMFIQGKSFDEIYDVFALRVIVDTINDCYNVLGIIHDMFTPLPNRFKDYISTPKQNMYQSLHTTVISKEGIPFEVQIRTWEMHHTAEYGIAAHWKYKLGMTSGNEKPDSLEGRLQWIRNMLDNQSESEDITDLVRSIKAFRSTLEEAALSDIILNVCDASSDEARVHMQVTTDLLNSLGCGDTPIITVLNKCDLLEEESFPQEIGSYVKISAKNGTGIDDLLKAVDDNLPVRVKRVSLLIPFSDAGLVAEIRKNATLISEEYVAEGIKVEAILDEKLYSKAEKYIVD